MIVIFALLASSFGQDLENLSTMEAYDCGQPESFKTYSLKRTGVYIIQTIGSFIMMVQKFLLIALKTWLQVKFWHFLDQNWVRLRKLRTFNFQQSQKHLYLVQND